MTISNIKIKTVTFNFNNILLNIKSFFSSVFLIKWMQSCEYKRILQDPKKSYWLQVELGPIYYKKKKKLYIHIVKAFAWLISTFWWFLGGSGIRVLGGSGSFSAVVLYSLRALKLTLSRCFTCRVPQQPWKGATPPPHPQPLLSCKQEAGAIGWVQIPGRKTRDRMWALNDPVCAREGNTCERGWEKEDLREWLIDNKIR